jgi:sRNA-binding regulator protein Hfq
MQIFIRKLIDLFIYEWQVNKTDLNIFLKTGHVACLRETTIVYKILVEKAEEKKSTSEKQA